MRNQELGKLIKEYTEIEAEMAKIRNRKAAIYSQLIENVENGEVIGNHIAVKKLRTENRLPAPSKVEAVLGHKVFEKIKHLVKVYERFELKFKESV